MDIRCGELQNLNVNINYWVNLWSDWNDYKELDFKNQKLFKGFHNELNLEMVRAYKENYSFEDKYYIFNNLVTEYENNKLLKIKKS